jgi:AcrR family transcriptional regulator
MPIYECTHLFMGRKSTRKSDKARKPESSRRAENKEKTKRAILKAALELFSSRGFGRTTTKEVSRKARIAEGTLFNYFRTKEDLALYFFEEELASLMTCYSQQKRLEHAALPEKLFAIIERHLERIGPYEDFIGAVYLRALQPVSKLSPLNLQTQSLNLRYLQFIRQILAEAEDAQEIPPFGDVGAYVVGLFQMAIISYWLQDGSPGKENTLALLDRSLKVANSVLKKGNWDW